MQTAHKWLVPLLAVAATAGTASASPRECRRLDGPSWDQHMSYAGCLRSALPVRVSDSERVRGYVDYLADSVQEPIAIYKDAIARAPWETRLLAAYSLGDTYVSLIVRARNAVDPPLRKDLEPLLVPFAREAIAAFTQAWALGAELPSGIACDDLVRNVIADTRDALDTVELP